ncbi:PAS domain S-box-containing protein [Desulfomicrobium norvegicum]|uniref:PAS domain S-box-containing protein n=1 Tax=Desulfomicrobium norvegicum (strain DSM 1741 / NCIMB 8310) TaxID=52561 RepID=A0A8G2C3E6_DESNO|nr:sigma 54-interacting transcriptional regulator [Desulfomicrobium norvegicum]SFL79877.1 PAS domain S-box-containing protein [Desulfomicrobium norvegicum]
MDDIVELQKLTSSISASMVMASEESLDAEILNALERIFAFLEVDRGGLLEVSGDSQTVRVSHVWYGKRAVLVSQEVNFAELFPWAYDHIVHQRRILKMTRTDELPPEAQTDRTSFMALGDKSTLSIPIVIGTRVHHIFTIDSMRVERDWPEEVVTQIRLLGEMFVSALQRREMEVALRRTMGRLDLAANSAGAGLWELDPVTGDLWATAKAKEHFGLPPEMDLTLQRLLEEIHPEDRELILERIEEARRSCEDLRVEYRVRSDDGTWRWLISRGRSQGGGIGQPGKILGVTLDVTQRRQLEQKLQEKVGEIERLRKQLELENQYLRNEAGAKGELGEILGKSKAMRTVGTMIRQVARTGSTVLLQGETGTGKTLVAHAIHNMSDRGRRVMVKVNCAALPGPLVESELFGREKGAFTGALSQQPGRFEIADGSTLFLDEVAEMSLETQAKLLRVLQDGEFERLGSSKTIKVDVRIIAASNKVLAKEVEAGRFRSDLYYRLNIFPILVPPLRERPDDIPQLVWEFVQEFGERMGKQIRRIAQKDMQLLMTYSWPGNIRELRNVIEHSLIISPGEVLVLQRLISSSENFDAAESLEELERRHIQAVLKATHGRIKGAGGAAERLAINPSTLYSRMRKLGIPSK